MGGVGLNWQFSGVGNFSGLGESDMLLRNANTGGLEVYDIANNQITNAAFIGTVGLNWQFSGVGNFSGISGETDMLLRNTNTGGLEVYDITTIKLSARPSSAPSVWNGSSRASLRSTRLVPVAIEFRWARGDYSRLPAPLSKTLANSRFSARARSQRHVSRENTGIGPVDQPTKFDLVINLITAPASETSVPW
jgi:hypothetical protein